MFTTIGTVRLILNPDYLLLDSSERLSERERVIVFQRIPAPELADNLGLDVIDIPKGVLMVIALQGNHLYLASRFQKMKTIKRTTKASPLEEAMQQILGGHREVTEEIPAGWSATLEPTAQHTIKIEEAIKIGDLVARA